nr:MAG TPA: hypothetical protein [Caudoviricetes sp.]
MQHTCYLKTSLSSKLEAVRLNLTLNVADVKLQVEL